MTFTNKKGLKLINRISAQITINNLNPSLNLPLKIIITTVVIIVAQVPIHLITSNTLEDQETNKDRAFKK